MFISDVGNVRIPIDIRNKLGKKDAHVVKKPFCGNYG